MNITRKLFQWTRSRSLWCITVYGGCCADEVFNVFGGTYDIQRFGCELRFCPEQADLLIVSGCISLKSAPHLKNLYEQMCAPKYVMAVGACAISGGWFASEQNEFILNGVSEMLPVDVFIPGCPPRPEAIMNGLIALQEKINSNEPLYR